MTKFIKVDASIDPIIEANYYCIFPEGHIFNIPFSKEFGFHEEFTDCSGITHYLLEIPDNESALINRNEELEAMLEEYQKCRNYKDDDWKEAIDGFRKLDKKITKLLNKNLKL